MWTGSGSVLPSPPDALKAPTNDPFTVLGPPPPTSYPTLVKVKNVCTVFFSVEADAPPRRPHLNLPDQQGKDLSWYAGHVG